MVEKSITMLEEDIIDCLFRNGYIQHKEFEPKQYVNISEFAKKFSDESLVYFIEFLRVRLQGIIFCQLAVTGKILQATEMERCLITQRSLFLLKNKILSLDEILIIKGKVTPQDHEAFMKICATFNQAEYNKLIPQAVAYMLDEDRRAMEWRNHLQKGLIGVKYTTSKSDIIPYVEGDDPGRTQADIDVDDPQIQVMQEPEVRGFELGDYAQSHHKQTTKIAIIATLSICIMASLLLLFSSAGPDTLFRDISYLYENKRYADVIVKCEEFGQQHATDKNIGVVKTYWQEALLIQADIAHRQNRKDDALLALKKAGNVWTDNQEKIAKLVQEIEQEMQSEQGTFAWKKHCNEYKQLAQEGNVFAAERKLSQLSFIAQQPTEKKELQQLQNDWQLAHYRYCQDTYRYLPYEYDSKNNIEKFGEQIPDFSKTERILLQGQYKKADGYFENSCIGFSIIHEYLYAISGESGDVLWCEFLGKNSRFDPIFVADKREYTNIALAEWVLVMSYKNSAKMLDIQTGKPIWETKLPGLIATKPLLFRGKIYLGCLDRHCYQLDVTTGKLEGSYTTERNVCQNLTIDGQKKILYIPTMDRIYGFSLLENKLELLLPLLNPAAVAVMAVFPYIVIAQNVEENTEIQFYHIQLQNIPNEYTYKAVILKKEMIPGHIENTGTLSAGLLAIATDSHLAVYGIHPTNPKESFFTVISPIVLENKGSAFFQFTNMLRSLLVIQKNMTLYELPNISKMSPGLIRQDSIVSNDFFPGMWTTPYIPYRSGNILFWTQKDSTTNTYQVNCIHVGPKLSLVWQRQYGIGIACNPCKTEDGRVFFLGKDASIHQFFYDNKISYYVLGNYAGSVRSWNYIPQDEGNFLLVKSPISLLSSVTGWLKDWKIEPMVTEHNIGQFLYQNDTLYFGCGNRVLGISSKTGKTTCLEYREFKNSAFHGVPLWHENALWIGNDDGRLYQLEIVQERGRPFFKNIWSFPTQKAIASWPVAYDKILYFGSDDGNMYAVDTVKKALVWQFSTLGSIQQPALVTKDRVYFPSEDGNIYCLNRTNGTLAWKSSTLGRVRAPLVYINNTIHAVSLAGEYIAYQAETGERSFSVRLGCALSSSPILLENIILVGGSDGCIYLFNQKK